MVARSGLNQFINDTLIFGRGGIPSADLAGFGVFLDFTGGVPMGITKTHLEREMTLKTTKLRNAISFALVAGTAVTGTAFAQDAAPAEQEATTLSQQRDTVFKGEMLRGTLLNAYAWSTMGRIAGIAATAAFAAAAVMAVLSVAGVVHLRKVTH